MTDDEWPAAELTRAVRRIETKIDAWRADFVSRELHERDIATLTDKHVDLAKWVMDIAAEGDRAARDRAEMREQHGTDLAKLRDDYRKECSAIREQMITRGAAIAMVGLLVMVVAAATAIVALVVH